MVYLVCNYADALVVIGFFLAIFTGCASLVLLAYGVYKKKHPIISISLGILLSIAISYCTLIYQYTLREKNANLIVQQLENYKKQNKNYPQHLSQLSPTFLPSVPKNYFGFFAHSFIYIPENNMFILKMENSATTGKVWISTEEMWDNYD